MAGEGCAKLQSMPALLDHVRTHKARHDDLSQQPLRNALSEFPGRICRPLFFAEHVPEEHVSRSLFPGRAVSPEMKKAPDRIGGPAFSLNCRRARCGGRPMPPVHKSRY